MRQRIQWLNGLKQKFKADIAALPCVKDIYDDNGNFVLIRFTDSAKVFAAMVEQGIILRDFANKPMLDNSVRVTIGDEAEMQAVLTVLQSLA